MISSDLSFFKFILKEDILLTTFSAFTKNKHSNPSKIHIPLNHTYVRLINLNISYQIIYRIYHQLVENVNKCI